MNKTNSNTNNTEFNIYKDIAKDLLNPINEDVDVITKIHLYLSKLIYLEHLHKRVFKELNTNPQNTLFKTDDICLILKAIKKNKHFIKTLYTESLHNSLSKIRS